MSKPTIVLPFAHPENETIRAPEYILLTADPKEWAGVKFFATWSVGGGMIPKGSRRIKGAPLELLKEVGNTYVNNAPLHGAAASWGVSLTEMATEVAQVAPEHREEVTVYVKSTLGQLAQMTFNHTEASKRLAAAAGSFALPGQPWVPASGGQVNTPHLQMDNRASSV